MSEQQNGAFERPARWSQVGRALASSGILLFIWFALSSCDREPGIIVNIAAWPDGVERIRVHTTIAGTAGTDFYLAKEQTRFAVRLPPGSQGTVNLEAAGLDSVDCRLAEGHLTEPVPGNLSRFVERRLEFSPLPAPMCIFGTATNFTVGTGPNSVAIGRLNSEDLTLDLAVANYTSTKASVLWGNGKGGFGFATDAIVGTPHSIAAGDFNGDMKLDLTTANGPSNTVSVMLGNGKGSFGNAINFTVGMNPYAIAVGDFNGDLHPDVATANFGGTDVSVLLGDGQGGFGVPTNLTTGDRPRGVAVGDFNGDLKLDLAVTNYGGKNVSVLLGDGQGGFGAPISFSVGIAPVLLAVGDFNGDMKSDLAVANLGSDNVSVLLGNGQGSFDTATHFPVGIMPISVVVEDFNGDMKADLAVASYGSDNIGVLLGNGTGSFGAVTNYSLDIGRGPVMVAVGDLNGDGKPDLAVASQKSDTVSILLNQF